MFYDVLLRFICILLPLFCWIVHLPFLLWNSSDPKGKFSFYACITNNKVLWICIVLTPVITLIYHVFTSASCSSCETRAHGSAITWPLLTLVLTVGHGHEQFLQASSLMRSFAFIRLQWPDWLVTEFANTSYVLWARWGGVNGRGWRGTGRGWRGESGWGGSGWVYHPFWLSVSS